MLNLIQTLAPAHADLIDLINRLLYFTYCEKRCHCHAAADGTGPSSETAAQRYAWLQMLLAAIRTRGTG